MDFSLSQEVLRFACLMEAKLRDSRKERYLYGSPAPEPDGSSFTAQKPDEVRYSAGKSLRTLFNELIRASRCLFEAVSHGSVTDRGLRPLSVDHIDRNPRRVHQVLERAVETSVLCLAMAEACGALGTEPTESIPNDGILRPGRTTALPVELKWPPSMS